MNRKLQKLLLSCLPMLLGQLSLAAQEAPTAGLPGVDFARDVQPLLTKHCSACHGSEKQESGFRIDQREAALVGGDSGVAIIPGKSADSKLIHFVTAADSDNVMPPKGTRLTAEEVGVLRAWIDEGAKWPDSQVNAKLANSHWAYQPLCLPAPPKVKLAEWPRNEIDQFVLASLEAKNIVPSTEADRYTLIRRLSLDLTGLLPSVQEVDAFVNDARPDAYEALVDRLLESPHFGERWGRHWLDMARYADSDGYEKDNPRPDAYRYRDWVIDAINEDMPFNQFTIEQLAGDLLPEATDMQRLATAFHRQTLTNTEGGTDQEQFRTEACFDRTETTGAIWLGLTVGCARCHTHKYDAITQREYYQLFAFFNNGDEQTHVVPKSRDEVIAYQAAKSDYDAKLAALTTELGKRQAEFGSAMRAWEVATQQLLLEAAAQPIASGALIEPRITAGEVPDGVAKIEFKVQKDGSYLVQGGNPDSADYLVTGRAEIGKFDTIRLDVMTDAALPAKGPGRVKHGNFVLSEVVCEIAESADFQQPRRLEFKDAKADYEQADKPWLAKNAIDGDDTSGWAIGSEYGKNHWAKFQLKESVTIEEAAFVRVTLRQRYGKQHTIGRFKLSLQTGFGPSITLPEQVAKAIAVPATMRSETEQKLLIDHFSGIDDESRRIVERLEKLKKAEPSKPELTVRVLTQRTKDPRPTFVLRRGEFLEPLKESEIEPGSFATLGELKSRNVGQRPDRLDLANWLVSKENAITPRVTVNYVWRLLFGSGIVRTVNDFGVRGDMPTHPELLDWLGASFIGLKSGDGRPGDGKAERVIAWSRKSLIKLIVMSATYRQTSKVRSEFADLDPQNLLLARQNRMRVEGEIVRDISLHAAGLISRRIGGPSVFPSLPPGVAELSYAGNFKWTVSEGADRYRRGMYTFFKRTSPHPNLITFDCPDANLTCVDRNRSNTPLQALIALNNDSFAEAARGLAKRTLETPAKSEKQVEPGIPVKPEVQSESIVAKLATAFRICVARPPSEFELQQLVELLENSQTWYLEHLNDAKSLVGSTSVPNVETAELAAWIATARILINLDEFITRE